MKPLLALLLVAALLPLAACGPVSESAVSPPGEENSSAVEDEEEWPEDEDYVEPPDTAVDDALPAPSAAETAGSPVADADETAPGGDVVEPPPDPVPADPNDPLREYIVIQLVDSGDKPVANVCGSITRVGAPGENNRIATLTAGPDKPEQTWSGEDGKLYLHVNDRVKNSWENTGTTSIHFHALHNPNIQMGVGIRVPETTPATITLRWESAAPPTEPPAQTTGICFYIVDSAGSPVRGVTLTGRPYPREYIESEKALGRALSEELAVLGPSDTEGIIRMPDALDGTFTLTAQKDGAGPTQQYEVLHQYLNFEEITLTWPH